MARFEEQLQYRRRRDAENFEDALNSIASAVIGRRLSDAMAQTEMADSALDEVLKFYHVKKSGEELPDSVTTLEDQMEYRLRPLGILRRQVQLEPGWYHHAVGPMLGTLREDGTLVALIPGRFAGYFMVEVKSGKRMALNRKTERLLDEEAMCFYQPLPLRSLHMSDLLRYLLRQFSVSDIALYIGMIAVSALLGMLSPVFTRWLFGDVLHSGSTQVLAALAAFMVSFTICRLLISGFQSLVSARIDTKQQVAVEAAVMGRILSLPARFFKNYSAGELTNRIAYVSEICAIIISSVGSVGITAIFSLIYIGQVFHFAPRLGTAAIVITLLGILVTLITTFIQMRNTRERMLAASKTSGMSYAMITGVQKIKLAGAEKRMFSRWARQYAKEAELEYNPPTFLKISSAVSLGITLLGGVLLYYLAIQNGVQVADYYAFNTAYAQVSGAFSALAGVVVAIAEIRPALEMAKPILEAEPEIAENKLVLDHLDGEIEMNRVSFRYDETMPNVIDNLSLHVKKGEYLAVVGTTGCGKSTLMRLLLGFEKPQKGSILFDKKDISSMDLKSLRRRIGTVMQDGKLFQGDIFSNIVIAAPQLTLEDAWEAARIAAIDEDIRAMPMGMHTVIGEGQGGVSGGQKQRLMIARAVAAKPGVLLFDEATSALDNITQKKVSEAIDSLHCTRIVIAHRLSTIRHCDRIIVMDKGHIVEEGTFEELLAQNGVFSDLVKRQRVEYEED